MYESQRGKQRAKREIVIAIETFRWPGHWFGLRARPGTLQGQVKIKFYYLLLTIRKRMPLTTPATAEVNADRCSEDKPKNDLAGDKENAPASQTSP